MPGHVYDAAGLGVVEYALHFGPDLVVRGPEARDIDVVQQVLLGGRVRAAHGYEAVAVGLQD